MTSFGEDWTEQHNAILYIWVPKKIQNDGRDKLKHL